MTGEPERSTREAKPAGARASPTRLVLPMILGLVLGSAAFASYLFWSQTQAQHALETAPGDPDLAKPSASECGVARAAMTAIHASGDDVRWRKAAGVKEMSLRAGSQVVNPVNAPGYSDDEADDLRNKTAADWRWCAGMGTFVRGLGWRPVSPDEDVAMLALGRPGMSKAGDEAKVYEAFIAPQENGALKVEGGPWLVTLNRDAGNVWRVTARTDLSRGAH